MKERPDIIFRKGRGYLCTVELKVGENEYGFTTELWGLPPNRFFVEIILLRDSGPDRCREGSVDRENSIFS
jgi:hypothetical protein